MSDVKFTKKHEWLRVEGGEVTIGISDFAQDQLGDVVFVELPELDKDVEAGDELAVIESVKTADDILAPVKGVVTAVNESLNDEPELVNQDPLGKGWFVKIKLAEGALDQVELLSESEYSSFTTHQD